MNGFLKRFWLVMLGGTVATIVMLGSGCSSDETTNPKAGEEIAKSRVVYVPKNDVEGKNYNGRQAISDNPSTILWCTYYPTNPNAKPVTVPIVGKLTSGNKRPYPTEKQIIDGDTPGLEFNPEVAGPDGMFGSSGEYRYGFDPAGNYHDFYNLETYCSTLPSTFQKNSTEIVLVGNPSNLGTTSPQAVAALQRCVKAAGVDKDGRSLYDPNKGCPEAARILGAS